METTLELIKRHHLTVTEYEKIGKHLSREPNLVELGVFSVMWSEHCSYKSSKLALKQLPTRGKNVLQGPGENAGVVDIGDGLCVVFKMESHNHPSFIEPFQGAATGVGGILRDIFTMGARPIAILDSLRFGAIYHSKTEYLLNGVVSGIAAYGNCMGIPTVGGEISFDKCYNGNILVNAMAVGIAKKDKLFFGKASGVGNLVIYVGSKTGRDGIHGATMASDSFDNTDEMRPTVQVGDPFTEKKLLEACLELMETDVIVGIQDMGAAGLTSSSVEMASRAKTGITINLDRVPLREEGMTPYEILLSESQERMLLVCPMGKEQIVFNVFSKWDLDACIIGEVTDDQKFVALHQGQIVAEIPVAALTDDAPVYNRVQFRHRKLKTLLDFNLAGIPLPTDYQKIFKTLITHPNLASKHWVYRQYDHQVMTNTLIKPGCDAAVIRIKGTKKALAISTDGNSRYCFLDPRTGGRIATAECGRNLICTGAKPIGLTDCLNFGNPERGDIMWQFTQVISGISDVCDRFGIPVISGNVSFYNDTLGDSIDPTPIIGMVGLIEDSSRIFDAYFKKEGDVIFLLGETKEELGATEYLNIIHSQVRGSPPELDLDVEYRLWKCLQELQGSETGIAMISSAHDLSEGGLAIAVTESCMGSKPLGAGILCNQRLWNDRLIRMDAQLFGETQSRVLVSCDPANVSEVEQIAESHTIPCHMIGRVTSGRISFANSDGDELIDLQHEELKQWWMEGFEKGIREKRKDEPETWAEGAQL